MRSMLPKPQSFDTPRGGQVAVIERCALPMVKDAAPGGRHAALDRKHRAGGLHD